MAHISSKHSAITPIPSPTPPPNPILDFVQCRLETLDTNGESVTHKFDFNQVPYRGNTFILPANMCATLEQFAQQQCTTCNLYGFNFSLEAVEPIGTLRVGGPLHTLLQQNYILYAEPPSPIPHPFEGWLFDRV